MAAQVRVLRQRVKSVRSTQKITKAQEMIATSRIAKAQAKVAAAAPYSRQITQVLSSLARPPRWITRCSTSGTTPSGPASC